jgi:hypothetical protein
MADPSPTDADAGQEPAADEGQEPTGEKQPDAPDGEKGRSYSEAYVKQLRREASGYRTKLAELEERLSEHEDEKKSEHERLTEKLAATESRASDAEVKLLRYEVAAEQGLDMQAAAFLTGSTREEIELRADELAKLLKDKAKPTAGGFDGGARPKTPDTRSPEEAHNEFLTRALGRQGRAS